MIKGKWFKGDKDKNTYKVFEGYSDEGHEKNGYKWLSNQAHQDIEVEASGGHWCYNCNCYVYDKKDHFFEVCTA